MALLGVGRESEAESMTFHRRRVTKVGPEVKHGGCARRRLYLKGAALNPAAQQAGTMAGVIAALKEAIVELKLIGPTENTIAHVFTS